MIDVFKNATKLREAPQGRSNPSGGGEDENGESELRKRARSLLTRDGSTLPELEDILALDMLDEEGGQESEAGKYSGPQGSKKTKRDLEGAIVKNKDRVLTMWSAHDNTLAILLRGLEAYNTIQPPFAACVILELHAENNKYIVKAFYKNDTSVTGDPYQLELPSTLLFILSISYF